MSADKQKLKALALSAPKGPWFGPEYAPGTSYVFDCDLGSLLHYESIETEQDSCLRFVTAANPANILGLIAEIESLEEHKQHLVDLRETHGFETWAAALVEIDRLKAENEALRRDAERYRWIENQPASWLALGESFDLPSEHEGASSLGSSIDAAMAKESGQ
nr:hypothetical protein [uncultured Pseudomonas sp.]